MSLCVFVCVCVCVCVCCFRICIYVFCNNNHLIKDKACDFFQPFQFGEMRQCIEDNWPKDEFVVLKVDMSNAFNLVSKQAMLDECAQHFPELLSWSCWCYSQHPIFWDQMGALSSQQDVQQGDPLGPFVFSLVLQCAVNTSKSDDGCVNAFNILQSLGPSLGLFINLKKCELLGCGNFLFQFHLSMFPIWIFWVPQLVMQFFVHSL